MSQPPLIPKDFRELAEKIDHLNELFKSHRDQEAIDFLKIQGEPFMIATIGVLLGIMEERAERGA